MLQIKNVYKEYKTGNLIQKALDNVSLNLRDNEFVAILGPSGSGKTTFLNIIGGLDRYDKGDLIINGISTKKYKDRDWDSYRNHTIGFVFQSYNLIPHQIEYLNSDSAKNIITNNLSQLVKSQNLDEQVSNIMEKYMQTAINTLSKSLQKEMQSSIQTLSKSITNAISIDENAFLGAFHIKMNEEEMSELFSTLMSKESVTYESNLKKLNYANLDEPSEISIYPKDFEGNKSITNLLNEYNTRMKEEGNDDKVISYTDMVGTLMSSVTTIVDTISYVLIAFVAISLVVSSIMIGVITYISVLERKKEIGILRAMGASKHNVAQVFNAETIIIGTLAGLIGVGITLLLIIPINQIIASIANGVNVRAVLPPVAGIILIVLSIVLTLIGGVIPSRKAAKEDPVLALRSE